MSSKSLMLANIKARTRLSM
uniref:Uncharacterized protein n=1 Tax=Arundo donax TaxID=35708 RepID=A0A0A9HQU8_ARUDO